MLQQTQQVNRRLTKQFYQDFNKENFYFSIKESEKHPTPALCIVIELLQLLLIVSNILNLKEKQLRLSKAQFLYNLTAR